MKVLPLVAATDTDINGSHTNGTGAGQTSYRKRDDVSTSNLNANAASRSSPRYP